MENVNVSVVTVGLLLVAMLEACAPAETLNAPDSVVDGCRHEITLLQAANRSTVAAATPDSIANSSEQAIADARTLKEESKQTGYASWPENALMYRCLSMRGVELTPEQSATLVKWQKRLGHENSAAPSKPQK